MEIYWNLLLLKGVSDKETRCLHICWYYIWKPWAKRLPRQFGWKVETSQSISRRLGYIPCVLFIDNLILFGEASVKQASIMFDILGDFCGVTDRN